MTAAVGSAGPGEVTVAAERMLAEGVRSRWGASARVTDAVWQPLSGFSSHPISRVLVTLADGTRWPVIVKAARPHPRRDPAREVLVYKHILSRAQAGAPELYASRCDPARGRYWLMIEDVGATRLQWCAVPEWERSLRWLAHLHTVCGPPSQREADAAHLRWHDRSFYRQLADAAVQSLRLHGSPEQADRLLSLCDWGLEPAAAAVTEQPATLLHGDLSCHNVMVQPHRIRTVDWEWAAVGPPAWDLAKLVAGWGKRTPRLLTAYRVELDRLGRPADPVALDVAVEQCATLHLLWYVGWWTRDCERPGAVGRILDRVERRWRRLTPTG